MTEPEDECQGEDEDYCPECFGTDITQNRDGEDVCVECRAVIDY